MNVALGFDQAQYGLLISYGFSLLYTLCSFPAGYAADRLPRKPLLLASAIGWALATAAQAGSSSFSQLLCARVMLGVAQAFSGPAAHTIISQLFPRGRATANAVYSSGIYFGAALASLSVLLNKALGWRATSLLVAAASAFPALVLALVLPSSAAAAPPPPTADQAADPSSADPSGVAKPPLKPPVEPSQSKVSIVLGSRTMRYVLAAAGARLFAGFAIGAWTAPFYRLYFPNYTKLFGVIYAAIVAVAGTFSIVAGGALSDRLVRGEQPHRAALVPLLGSLVAVPFWIGAMTAPSFFGSVCCLLLAFVCAECWFGATISLMQGALPSAVWGTAQGMLNVVQIVGNASPILIGALMQRGMPLRRILAAAVPAAYVVCAGFFYLAGEARLAHDTGGGEQQDDGSGRKRAA